MTLTDPARIPDEFDAFATRLERRRGFLARRREKVVAEIERNRRGEHRVPTWVLAAAVAAIVVFWAAIVIFA